MSKYDAEYVRQWRRPHGIPERASFAAAKLSQLAAEQRHLEQLLWPRNLFGEPATIVELLAATAQLSEQIGEKADYVCSCGCHSEQKRNVSQTLRNPYGRGFDVIFSWLDACKSR